MAASPSSVPRLMSSRSDVSAARHSPACKMTLIVVMRICNSTTAIMLPLVPTTCYSCLAHNSHLSSSLLVCLHQCRCCVHAWHCTFEFLRPALHIAIKQQLEQLWSAEIIMTICIRLYNARPASAWPSVTFYSQQGHSRHGLLSIANMS